METQTIRLAVVDAAPSQHAIWPNGLGYTWRGWEYSYGNGCWGGWCALRVKDGALGCGSTPQIAYDAAIISAREFNNQRPILIDDGPLGTFASDGNNATVGAYHPARNGL